MARKKMDREELMEFRGGKYMGGPAEERAEKMKKKSTSLSSRGAGRAFLKMAKSRSKGNK